MIRYLDTEGPFPETEGLVLLYDTISPKYMSTSMQEALLWGLGVLGFRVLASHRHFICSTLKAMTPPPMLRGCQP